MRLLAAWRGLGGFEGRSSLRSWLYRIATHACLRLAGCDAMWSMWQWLDRAPLGRNEQDMTWFHRHDEYPM